MDKTSILQPNTAYWVSPSGDCYNVRPDKHSETGLLIAKNLNLPIENGLELETKHNWIPISRSGLFDYGVGKRFTKAQKTVIEKLASISSGCFQDALYDALNYF